MTQYTIVYKICNTYSKIMIIMDSAQSEELALNGFNILEDFFNEQSISWAFEEW